MHHRLTFRNLCVAIGMINVFFIMSYASAHDALPSAYPVHGFKSPVGSRAFQQYLLRPPSELSKIIYLLDRLADSPLEVIYEGDSYPAPFAANVSRVYVTAHYRQETVERWIQSFCYRSIDEGKPIWFKYPDGFTELARDAANREMRTLNQLVKEYREEHAKTAAQRSIK